MSKTGVVMLRLRQKVYLVSNSMKQAAWGLWNVILHLKTRFPDVLEKPSHVLLVSLVLGSGLFYGGIHFIEEPLI